MEKEDAEPDCKHWPVGSNCSLVDLERRPLRQNSVLADNGFVVGGSAATLAAVDADFFTAVPPDFRSGGRGPSTVDTELLLSAILTQLRYITTNLRRHCISSREYVRRKTCGTCPSLSCLPTIIQCCDRIYKVS